MTQFETELIRAMEHKCPFCGWDEVSTRCYVGAWIHLLKHDAGKTLRWTQKNYLDTADRIVCGNIACNKELWTAENGWVPGLQEIVKGE